MEDQLVTFIKAINKHYFDSFINEGKICMNTIEWFQEYEKIDANIGDEFEGASMVCGKGFKIRFADPIVNCNSEEEVQEKLKAANWSEPLENGFNLKMHDKNSNGNIFSLYAIKLSSVADKSGCYLVPQKFKEEFTNHRFVLFLQPDSFISRIKTEIDKLGKQLKGGLVRYYPLDESLLSNLNLFDKPDKYAYQSEYRLVINDANAVQRIFNIGPLNDLCYEIDLNQKYVIDYEKNAFSISMKDEELIR